MLDRISKNITRSVGFYNICRFCGGRHTPNDPACHNGDIQTSYFCPYKRELSAFASLFSERCLVPWLLQLGWSYLVPLQFPFGSTVHLLVVDLAILLDHIPFNIT
ncbi:hypothetical protein T01_6044 [Trichinella spiralis]|uniref:Uncharacterized protein n=1 Tax=Trichinella spiralis TaxID=6334 RepID=A0A0V1AQ84_TRISP|nr:hypothetical protein T01_6044 [Trichinella spiralis]